MELVLMIVFYGFIALLVATGLRYVVKVAVLDALREYERERARDRSR